MKSERRAYYCAHKDHPNGMVRVFLFPGDPEPPRCPKHGPMKRQANMPYNKPKGKR